MDLIGDSYLNALIPDAVVGKDYPHSKHHSHHWDCLVGAEEGTSLSEDAMKAKALVAISGMFDPPLAISAKGGVWFDDQFGGEKIQNGVGKGGKFREVQDATKNHYAGLICANNNDNIWYSSGEFNAELHLRNFLHSVREFFRRYKILIICSILPREKDYLNDRRGERNKKKFNQLLLSAATSGHLTAKLTGKSSANGSLLCKGHAYVYDAGEVVPATTSREHRRAWYCKEEWRRYYDENNEPRRCNPPPNPPVHYNARTMFQIVTGMVRLLKERKRKLHKKKHQS